MKKSIIIAAGIIVVILLGSLIYFGYSEKKSESKTDTTVTPTKPLANISGEVIKTDIANKIVTIMAISAQDSKPTSIEYEVVVNGNTRIDKAEANKKTTGNNSANQPAMKFEDIQVGDYLRVSPDSAPTGKKIMANKISVLLFNAFNGEVEEVNQGKLVVKADSKSEKEAAKEYTVIVLPITQYLNSDYSNPEKKTGIINPVETPGKFSDIQVGSQVLVTSFESITKDAVSVTAEKINILKL